MKWAWDYILHPVWLAVKAVAMWLWESILKKVFTWIGDHWEEIVLGIKLAWEKYLKPTWERVKSVATWLWERSEEHTSELQSRGHLVCRLLLEKKNNN